MSGKRRNLYQSTPKKKSGKRRNLCQLRKNIRKEKEFVSIYINKNRKEEEFVPIYMKKAGKRRNCSFHLHNFETTFKIPRGFTCWCNRWNFRECWTCPNWSLWEGTTLVGSRAQFPILSPLFITLELLFPPFSHVGKNNLWSHLTIPMMGKEPWKDPNGNFPVESSERGTGEVFAWGLREFCPKEWSWQGHAQGEHFPKS